MTVPYHVLHPKPYFFHHFLQRLPKLAVAAWSCLVVASESGLLAQRQINAKVLVGARLSIWSHQFISNVFEYIHVDIFQLTNGFCHSKQAWKPINICIDLRHLHITGSCQEAWAVTLKQANDNISSHSMPH
jgi:hypothetical protein